MCTRLLCAEDEAKPVSGFLPYGVRRRGTDDGEWPVSSDGCEVLLGKQEQPVSLVLRDWARLENLVESLILAQDQRWRRA